MGQSSQLTEIPHLHVGRDDVGERKVEFLLRHLMVLRPGEIPGKTPLMDGQVGGPLLVPGKPRSGNSHTSQ